MKSAQGNAGGPTRTSHLRDPVDTGHGRQAIDRRTLAAVRGRGVLLAGRPASGRSVFGPAGHDRLAGTSGCRARWTSPSGVATTVSGHFRADSLVDRAYRHALVRLHAGLAGRQPDLADAAIGHAGHSGCAGCADGLGGGAVHGCRCALAARGRCHQCAGARHRLGHRCAQPLSLRRRDRGGLHRIAVHPARARGDARSAHLDGADGGRGELVAAAVLEYRP